MTEPTTGRDAPILEVSDLNVTFRGGIKAVRGVSYRLNRGEILGIVGESGSGKSVTSLAVMGLLPEGTEISGSVRLHGKELIGAREEELTRLRGKSVSMIFQDPLSAFTPVYTIGDQIAEAVRIHQKVGKDQAARRAVELLDLVGIPRPDLRAKAFPHEFSGGMRQRAMIAMAIANDPDVLICDEPTTALDVTIQAQVLEVLKTAQRETGAGIVMITHDLGVVAGLADRVLVMYAGKPVETGTVEEIYYRPRQPYTMGLLASIPRMDRPTERLIPIEGNPPSPAALPPGCPFAPRCPLKVEACDDAEPELERIGTGGRMSACIRSHEIDLKGLDGATVYPVPEAPAQREERRPRAERETVLKVDDLVRHYPLMKGAVFKRQVGTVHAVDGISFDIAQGETLALVGESGCGKTTTLQQIMQLQAPQGGTVVVLGKDSAKLGKAERKELRRDLQIVFQDPMAALDPRMPVGDILAEPLRAHGYKDAKAVRARVAELLTLVGLAPEHAERYPQHFSGGQRQRIGIARALALEPKLIVLDEPVSALDVSIQAGVINLLEDLKARLGLSYLFVAHDLSVVRHLADRVAVMYLGKIAEIGAVDEVYGAPAHPYTRALLSAIPLPDPELERSRTRILLEGDLPSPADPPSGCRFRTRCPKRALLGEAEARKCDEVEPTVERLAPAGDHGAACHYPESTEAVAAPGV
ncbi:oligopeptide ABC transporter ATP-binding protein OppF [Planobispora rosea]|uniref:Oligopeptide ABC transporter ATP-binding protein OppF n=1 Tax=Planobispora rosea TaxID=35762 RepID=A0A8J3WH00_PLARO|nr:ABC transporter ATP-binding protein [Planobispora rosea]GGT06613.1 oligopeptide ABC transporter ATP-binding protein OppF [Planobispora rosea]GIH89045.1 oligopeptide ABC transporter ATP-binding protein OppF [Planobispora rosea]